MKSIEKNFTDGNDPGRIMFAPSESKNLVRREHADTDALYYPLFPPEQNPAFRKETYLRLHEKLMMEMRIQMRLKNRLEIEKTGRRLHHIRKKYRTRFAA